MTLKRERRSSWISAGVLCVVTLLVSADEGAALGRVGLRVGWSDASGEVLQGGGALGGTDMVGIHLAADLLSLLEIEIAGEYINEEFGFSEAVLEGVKAAGKGDFEDITMLATARIDLLRLAPFPVQGYVGGGLNVHWTDLQLRDVVEATQRRPVPSVAGPAYLGAPGTEELEEAVEKVAGENSEAGWHLVAGLRLSSPGLPVALFLEGRHLDGFSDGVPESRSVYAGFSLGL
jgi:hypothetical protein